MIEVLLGSRTRAGILRALFLGEKCSYRLLELARAVGTSVSSVQAELVRLEGIGLVRSERTGGARVIRADVSHPLAAPLRVLLEADSRTTDLDAPSVAPMADAILARLNPVVRPFADRIAAAGSRQGALKVALVGSAAQPDADVVPGDLDVLVRLDPTPEGYAARYFALLAELEGIMDMPVDIIEEDALTNPYLAEEFAATQVVLYEAA